METQHDADKTETSHGAESGLPATRTRTRTAKGLEYEIKVRKDALLRARHAFVSKLQDLQTFHIDCRDPEDLKTKIKHIESLLTGYREILDVLATSVDHQEHEGLQDTLEALQTQWNTTKISVLSEIEKLENDDGTSRHSRSIAASRKSFASGTGSSSSTREKRLDAQAKAAALRSRMQVQEEIIRHKRLMAEQEAKLERLRIIITSPSFREKRYNKHWIGYYRLMVPKTRKTRVQM